MSAPTDAWTGPLRSPSWWALGSLFGFSLVAVVGYSVFGLNPELLPASAFARWVFQYSFPLFAQAQIVLAALVLAVPLVRHAGRFWILPLVAIYALSFLSEFVGTGYGIPFGPYEYTALLGPRLGGRVPVLIPLSWFLMALPSYALARVAFPGSGGVAGRLALGTAWLVCWDLALDPAMSFLVPYWRWGEIGPYYGMPLLNLAGWAATGVVLMGVLEVAGARAWSATIPARWMAGYWASMVLLPLGMLVGAGAWLGVGVTLGATTLLTGVTVSLRGRSPATPEGVRPTRTAPAPEVISGSGGSRADEALGGPA